MLERIKEGLTLLWLFSVFYILMVVGRSRRYDIRATTYRHMGELRELSEQRSYSRGGIVPVALSR